VKLSPGLAETIIVHAREEFPNECCGLIAGKDGVATRVLPATNAEGTPFARLKVAQLALKVKAQRLALDESKGRLLDVATANATIDEIASTMRDALL